jgi:hypothetical protein
VLEVTHRAFDVFVAQLPQREGGGAESSDPDDDGDENAAPGKL